MKCSQQNAINNEIIYTKNFNRQKEIKKELDYFKTSGFYKFNQNK